MNWLNYFIFSYSVYFSLHGVRISAFEVLPESLNFSWSFRYFSLFTKSLRYVLNYWKLMFSFILNC